MQKIAIFAALCCSTVMLSGCVSEKTALTNSEGKQIHCDAWGFGLLGVPVALASHADCMKKAKAAGYSESPQSTTPKPVTN
jgi:hypothetical protein